MLLFDAICESPFDNNSTSHLRLCRFFSLINFTSVNGHVQIVYLISLVTAVYLGWMFFYLLAVPALFLPPFVLLLEDG